MWKMGKIKKVLIVEDDKSLIDLYSALIKKQYKDVSIDFTLNAREAERKALTCDYALILLAIKMYEVSGIDFYKNLKKRSPSIAKKVVFISASLSVPHASYLTREGRPYLFKPFRIKDFYNMVKSYLDTGKEEVRRRGFNYSRQLNRLALKKKCIVKIENSNSIWSEFITGETVNYSKEGLGIEYVGNEVPLGTVLNINITDKEALGRNYIVVWSSILKKDYFRLGLQCKNIDSTIDLALCS